MSAPFKSCNSFVWCTCQFLPITCGLTQYFLRRKVLEGDMSRYVCCQGYTNICCFQAGTLGEQYCPDVCLCCESCCCNGFAISASRMYMMDRYQLASDPCDYRLIRINNCIQILSCFCNILAVIDEKFQHLAGIIDRIADFFYHLVSGCMTAQVSFEMDYQLAQRTANVGNQAFFVTAVPETKHVMGRLKVHHCLFWFQMSAAKRFTIVTVSAFVTTQIIAWLASGQENKILHRLAFFSIIIQWIVFIHASGVLGNGRTERFFDLTGSLTFISLTTMSISSLGVRNMSWRQVLMSLAVLLWSIRLGSFLFTRINRDGGIDSRFIEVKKSVLRFWGFWTIQGVWVFIVSSPVLILNSGKDSGPISLNVVDFLGLGLFLFGFAFEVVADHQKTIWKMNKDTHNQFIQTGLWKISRHPNYFGEICLWCGIFLTCSNGYETLGQYISVLSPIFTALLLINVSGIPLLEKKSDEHWGDDAEYKAYKQNVPVLIPIIGRRGNARF